MHDIIAGDHACNEAIESSSWTKPLHTDAKTLRRVPTYSLPLHDTDLVMFKGSLRVSSARVDLLRRPMPANAVHIEILSMVYSCLSSYQDVGVQSVEGKACEEEPQERQEGGGAEEAGQERGGQDCRILHKLIRGAKGRKEITFAILLKRARIKVSASTLKRYACSLYNEVTMTRQLTSNLEQLTYKATPPFRYHDQPEGLNVNVSLQVKALIFTSRIEMSDGRRS